MYAKNLEGILTLLCCKSDVSHGFRAEMADRFATLRNYGRMPRGRDRREQPLTDSEIAAAVFGLVSVSPNWAGHAAIILEKLRPVGGVTASFFGTSTLSDAVVALLKQEEARKSFVRMRVTVAETGVNSNGGASITFQHEGQRRTAYYVPELAGSLTASGRDATFDPDRDRLCAAAMREMTFNREFFRRLADECRIAELYAAPPKGDGSEYDAEESRQRRYEELGVRSNSRFLNIGVDTQLTWPKEELLIKFDRYSLVLMPKTEKNAQSVHMDLYANRLTDEDAITVINRFLSIMAWCDDQAAVLQFGWSGNPVPVEVARLNISGSVASPYIFDRKIPVSEDAQRALALYREARTAEQNGFISYAVLNYFKIIEIKHPNNPKRWFRENFPSGSVDSYEDEFKQFNELRGQVLPEDYIFQSCRIAVAHASNKSKSDPDDAHEVRRLHTAAKIMRHLARKFIETEFGVSDSMYSGD